jgi:exoribonuclease R
MEKMKSPLPQLLEEIKVSRRNLLRETSAISASEAARRIAPGTWSVQEVVEHLVLAERVGFDFIYTAAEKFREGDPVWAGTSSNEGLPIEEVIARTWQEKEKAPESASPTGKYSLGVWAAHLRNCDNLLENLPPILAGLPLHEVVYPHFLCGPLNVIQRLEFIRFHIDRHHAQVIEIIKSLKTQT